MSTLIIDEQFLHVMKWYKPFSKSDIKWITDLKNSKNNYILEVLKIFFLLVTLEVLNTFYQLYL